MMLGATIDFDPNALSVAGLDTVEAYLRSIGKVEKEGNTFYLSEVEIEGADDFARGYDYRRSEDEIVQELESYGPGVFKIVFDRGRQA